MTPSAQCPRCGNALATDAPEGLCPACLMEQGLEIPSTDEGEAPDSAATTKAAEPREDIERVIGPYRLLQKLGEGGMGEVWLAEQQEPVRRKVALKIIKRGMDSKQVVSRFEAERQALAMMEHPSIARVFDAGTTPRGRPFFVMEHVRGIPITAHCDRNRLSTRDRLDLFQQVCAGVQHAHQKGIIHRDLKPSNVLVTIQDGKATPKIIDFGVAKATEHRLTEHSVFTEIGVLIGTPEYMSPEQADLTAQDIDTRTDVYSLGVLLYELLAGALPFDSLELRKAGFDEIRRKIREDDPPKPSTRLSTLGGEKTTEAAKARKTDPTNLKRQISGDLDWITMRALEKDRTRRYGSPNELAADVARHLADEPVLAGPPSAGYRARKFVRRNKVGVGFAAVLALVLIGFAVTMTVQAGLIARERDRANEEAERANLEAERANREADTANRVSTFMVRLFEIPDPGQARGNEVTAREILDKGAEQIERGLMDDPLVRARLMATMGKTYGNLGLLESGDSLLQRALAIREAHPDTSPTELADNLVDIGWLRMDKVAVPTANLHYLERALAVRRAQVDPEPIGLSWNLSILANYEWQLGRMEAAKKHTREALAILERYPDALSWRAAYPITGLSIILFNEGEIDQAVALALESVELFDRAQARGEYWPPTEQTLAEAAITLRDSGRLDEADPLFRRALEYNEGLYGAGHPRVARVLCDWAHLKLDLGRREEGRALVERAAAMVPPESDSFQRTRISKALLHLGDVARAYEYRRQFMEGREADSELARSPMLLLGRLHLAHLLMRLGRPADARVHYLGAIELFEDGVEVNMYEHHVVVAAVTELAVLVAEAGHQEDALRLFELAVLGVEDCVSYYQRSSLASAAHRDWAALLRRMGRAAEAAEHEAVAAELSAGAADAVAAGN